MWKPERKGPEIMLEFLNKYSELSQSISKFLEGFRLFLAPINVDVNIQRRIEGVIAKSLLEQQGMVSEFHDHEEKYTYNRTKDPIKLVIESDAPILGLSNELLI